MNKKANVLTQQINEVVRTYSDALKGLSVSDSEFWIWYMFIALDDEYSQQDICNIWSLPKQTVNTIITHMRLKKYMYLEKVPGTRNRKVVRLTETGRAYGESIVLPILHAEERAVEKFSSEEFEQIMSSFKKYIEVLKEEFKSLQ